MARSDRRRWLIAAAAMTATGALLLVIAWRQQQSAPTAEPAGTVSGGRTPSPSGGSSGSPPSARPEHSPPLGPSRPVRLRIPAIDVATPVAKLGLAADGTLEVPRPGPHLDEAAWFERSPTPGQPGPAIIEGHVDTEQGPSVFFRLGDIRLGDKIHVRRADDTRLVFTVTAIRDFPKAEFPTELVYGSDLSEPTLRLITCSDFDRATRHHEGNQVVFARLAKVRGR